MVDEGGWRTSRGNGDEQRLWTLWAGLGDWIDALGGATKSKRPCEGGSGVLSWGW